MDWRETKPEPPENIWMQSYCSYTKRTQKFDSKGEELTFTGYCENSKGYRLIEPRTKKITKSRDVVFLKEFKENKIKELNSNRLQLDEKDESTELEPTEKDNDLSDAESTEKDDKKETISEYSDCIKEEELERPVETQSNLPIRSTRVPNVNRDDFHLYLTEESTAEIPETVEEALASLDNKHCVNTLEEKHRSLVANNTWTEVDLPIGQKTLNTKWVFKKKEDSSGNIQRYKARLVAKGCGQVEGIDFQETYSPVVRYASIRFLCALAVKYDLHIHQMNVTAAYLHGNIDDDIYLQLPNKLAKDKRKV